jgi:hypothetical protein
MRSATSSASFGLPRSSVLAADSLICPGLQAPRCPLVHIRPTPTFDFDLIQNPAWRRLDLVAGAGGAILAAERRPGKGNVGEDVEQVALLGVDDLLHLGQHIFAEAASGEPCRSILRASGSLQILRNSSSSLKQVGYRRTDANDRCCR